MMVFLIIVAAISFLSAITKTGTLNQDSAKWCFVASVVAMVVVRLADIIVKG